MRAIFVSWDAERVSIFIDLYRYIFHINHNRYLHIYTWRLIAFVGFGINVLFLFSSLLATIEYTLPNRVSPFHPRILLCILEIKQIRLELFISVDV